MASLLNLSCDQIRQILTQCGCQCQGGGPGPQPGCPHGCAIGETQMAYPDCRCVTQPGGPSLCPAPTHPPPCAPGESINAAGCCQGAIQPGGCPTGEHPQPCLPGEALDANPPNCCIPKQPVIFPSCPTGEHPPPCLAGETVDPVSGCCAPLLPPPGGGCPCSCNGGQGTCQPSNILQIGATPAPRPPEYISDAVYAGVQFATDACQAQPAECTDAQLFYNCKAACERIGGSEADCMTGCQGYYV